jgi:biotin carboxylase
MRKALVSIAAGRSQLPLLRAAEREGLAAIGVDRDPAAEGLGLCDERVACSTHDPDAVLAGLAPLRARYEIVAVATQSSGRPVATAARVAAALGLPGLDPERAERATTKPGMLALARAAGVAVPLHRRCRALADATELAPPLVVKPALTVVGKAGVRLVRERSGLPAAFEEARAASADGAVEVEAFVPGADVVLAAHFAADALRPLALLDEDTRFDGEGRARGWGIAVRPGLADEPEHEDVVAGARRLVRGLGRGIGFFTFRVAAGAEPVFLEMHLDLAGDWVLERLLARALPEDPILDTLRLVRGAALGYPWPPRTSCALRHVFARDLGTRPAARLAELRRLSGVVDVHAEPASAAGDPWSRAGTVLVDPVSDPAVVRAIERVLGRAAERSAA